MYPNILGETVFFVPGKHGAAYPPCPHSNPSPKFSIIRVNSIRLRLTHADGVNAVAMPPRLRFGTTHSLAVAWRVYLPDVRARGKNLFPCIVYPPSRRVSERVVILFLETVAPASHVADTNLRVCWCAECLVS